MNRTVPIRLLKSFNFSAFAMNEPKMNGRKTTASNRQKISQPEADSGAAAAASFTTSAAFLTTSPLSPA